MRAQEVGKGESHSHPYHVDNSSRIKCLVAITCALRWGVTHVG